MAEIPFSFQDGTSALAQDGSTLAIQAGDRVRPATFAEWLETYTPQTRYPLNGDILNVGPDRLELTDKITEPMWIDLPGASGDYASTPDTAALDITGDICLTCHANIDWTQGANASLLTKWDGGVQRSYMLLVAASGKLQLYWSVDGSASLWEESSVAVPFYTSFGDSIAADGWVAVTFDVSGYTIRFWTSNDGVSWTQLGTDQTGAATSIHPGTSPVEAGSYDDGTGFPCEGDIYTARIYDGIGAHTAPAQGTLVADLDAQDFTVGGTTATDSTGLEWTVNGTASIQERGFDEPQFSPMTELPRWRRRQGVSSGFTYVDTSSFEVNSNTQDVLMVVEITDYFDQAEMYGLYSNGDATNGSGAYIDGGVLHFVRTVGSTVDLDLSYAIPKPGTYVFHFYQPNAAGANYLFVNGQQVASQTLGDTGNNGTGDPRIGGYVGRNWADDGDLTFYNTDTPPAVIIAEVCSNIDLPTSGYVTLADDTDHVRTPDSVALSPTGDFSVIVHYKPTAGAGSFGYLASKWNSSFNPCWYMARDTATDFIWVGLAATSGGQTFAAISTGTVDDDVEAWVAFTFDSSNGSSKSEIIVWVSTNGVNWTNIGSAEHTSVVTAYDSGAPITVGATEPGISVQDGEFYSAKFYDGIGDGSKPGLGTLVGDLNAADFANGDTGTDTADDSLGNTWTLYDQAVVTRNPPVDDWGLPSWDFYDLITSDFIQAPTTDTPIVTTTIGFGKPSDEIVDAIEDDVVSVVSYVDVYENDGATIFAERVPVVEGTVSVDMTRDERRNLDITLHDQDGELGYGPGAFWYDKILVPYRGIMLSSTEEWVVPLGRFYPDSITRPRFPNTIQATCRDGSKILQLVKFHQTTSWPTATNVGTIIQAIALNGGITEFDFESTTATLSEPVSYNPGDSRWQACSDLALGANYEVFFDAIGRFVFRPQQNPTAGVIVHDFRAGDATANLSEYSRTTNDSLLKNDVVVVGDSENNALVIGRSTNTDNLTPTSVDNIGRRTKVIPSQHVPDNAAAILIADSFLSVAGLEQYDLTLDGIVIPWLEAGQPITTVLPDADPTDPTRFLMSSFSIPLGTGTMNGLVKRVINLV